ncbi:MAG: ATP-dependent zinc metalloprotease FtsH [Verrucomicrobiota bacterium]|nr:ATP-dependent zinc metalloprotease FtsH [Limisphaera sp.]MDW8380549.1 ATP-dependent zinc metalloprotease FtsH [Verrucomicrobiota bacterium]
MKKDPPQLKLPGRFGPHGRFLLFYLLATMLVLWSWQEWLDRWAVQTIPYSRFKQHLRAGEVKKVEVHPTEILGRIEPATNRPLSSTSVSAVRAEAGSGQALHAEESSRLERPFSFRTVRVEDPDLVKDLEAAEVEFSAVRPGVMSQLVWGWLLPLGLMVGLFVLLNRRLSAAGEQVLGMGRSRARLIVDKNTGVTFADVAGCEEAKQELKEVVDFLKNPAVYEHLGARIPKGVLLVGPPGTGKTLLARAVAGEAGVPFFAISGADFVEMFVGVGAARVRDLFKQAKEHAPCIIFVDEIDAIGRQRGVHLGPANDEREQTLNALLVEMDGFEPNAGVILLAATNRPEILDRALLRPGRFDRQVVVDAPDIDGREAILKVHARRKKLAPDVDLRRVAAATAGFSGADLANVLNEAALLAARRQADAIAQQDLEAAIEKVVAGPERRSRRLNAEEKRRVAYHEVGHALVAAYCAHADPVHKISIVPRGRAALGYTLQLPQEDQYLLTRSELYDRLKCLLGGRAAEELVFGEVSTGAQNDLERATSVARHMVAVYGMNERIGLVHCAQQGAFYLGGPDGGLQRDCSEQTAREIDEEVRSLLQHAYEQAKEILADHRDQLETLAAELLARETLDGEEFYRRVGKVRPSGKEPVPVLPPPGPLTATGAAGSGVRRSVGRGAASPKAAFLSAGLESML